MNTLADFFYDAKTTNARINGTVGLGLTGGMDKGVASEYRIKIPACVVSKYFSSDPTDIGKVGDPMSNELMNHLENGYYSAVNTYDKGRNKVHVYAKEAPVDRIVIHALHEAREAGGDIAQVASTMEQEGYSPRVALEDMDIARFIKANTSHIVNITPTWAKYFIAARLFALLNGGIGYKGEWDIVEDPDVDDGDLGINVDHVKEAYLNIGLIIYCAKVMFWKTGHHLGGKDSRISASLKKMLNAAKLDFPSATELDLGERQYERSIADSFHKIVHVYDTRNFLFQCGIVGVVGLFPWGFPVVLNFAKDRFTSLRVSPSSFPAGVARLALIKAGIRSFIRNKYFCLYSITDELQSWKEDYDMVYSKPGRYHVGAGHLYLETAVRLHLGGFDEVPVIDHKSEHSERLLHGIAAATLVYRKGSQFAKSPIIKNLFLDLSSDANELVDKLKGLKEKLNILVSDKVVDLFSEAKGEFSEVGAINEYIKIDEPTDEDRKNAISFIQTLESKLLNTAGFKLH
jgi:hypothetical protein